MQKSKKRSKKVLQNKKKYHRILSMQSGRRLKKVNIKKWRKKSKKHIDF